MRLLFVRIHNQETPSHVNPLTQSETPVRFQNQTFPRTLAGEYQVPPCQSTPPPRVSNSGCHSSSFDEDDEDNELEDWILTVTGVSV